MTDGLLGTNSYKSGWQGYEGSDMEFTVNLLQPTQMSSVSLNFVKSPSDWVLFPNEVQYSFSTDGKTWQNQQTIKFDNNSVSVKEIKTAKIDFTLCDIQYIRVSAISPKVLPDWHEYKGQPCWIFADELIVE